MQSFSRPGNSARFYSSQKQPKLNFKYTRWIQVTAAVSGADTQVINASPSQRIVQVVLFARDTDVSKVHNVTLRTKDASEEAIGTYQWMPTVAQPFLSIYVPANLNCGFIEVTQSAVANMIYHCRVLFDE